MGISHLADSMEDSLVIEIYELLKDTLYLHYDDMDYDMFERFENAVIKLRKVVE